MCLEGKAFGNGHLNKICALFTMRPVALARKTHGFDTSHETVRKSENENNLENEAIANVPLLHGYVLLYIVGRQNPILSPS